MPVAGRINVYIGEELRQALRLEAIKKNQTLGEYLSDLLRKTFKIKSKKQERTV